MQQNYVLWTGAPSKLQFIPLVQSKEEINPFSVKMFEIDFMERILTPQALSKEDRKASIAVEMVTMSSKPKTSNKVPQSTEEKVQRRQQE